MWEKSLLLFLILICLTGCSETDANYDTVAFQVPETSYRADDSTISYRFFQESRKYPLPSTYVDSSPVANILTIPYTIGDVAFPYNEKELKSELQESEEAFFEASHGNMGINLVQTSPLQASKSFLEQLSDSKGIDDYSFAQGLAMDLEHALSGLFSSDDFLKFDSNSDGILDSLVVLRRVGDEYKDANRILTKNCAIRPSDGSLLSPHIAQIVFIDAEDIGKDSHCLISHELGHAMGLPDFYDYLGLTKPLNYPVANFLMGTNGASEDRMGFSIFSRYLLGWEKPDYFVTPEENGAFSSQNITLDCKKGESIYIGLDDEIESSPFGQYLILQSTIHEGEPALLVFHADARLENDEYADYHNRFITNPFATNNRELQFAFDNNPGKINDPLMKHPLIYQLSNVPNRRDFILSEGARFSSEELTSLSYFSVGDLFNVGGEDYRFYGDRVYDYVSLNVSFEITDATQNEIALDFSPKAVRTQTEFLQ